MFHVALRLRLGDLNYNFEWYWTFELSNNNLASELVENRSTFYTNDNQGNWNFYDYYYKKLWKILATINSQLIADTYLC